MTEPGSAADTGLACPFVAFEDDRDSRATRPDHRHRCYAEARPAPRAIAHQEAYCLSPGFARCPTFIDWARREAARATPDVPKVRSGIAGGAVPDPSRYLADETDAAGESAAGSTERAQASSALVDETADRPPSRSQRDWAAPPPWRGDEDRTSGAGAAAAGAAGGAAAAGAAAAAAAGTAAGAPDRPRPPAEEVGAPSFLATDRPPTAPTSSGGDRSRPTTYPPGGYDHQPSHPSSAVDLDDELEMVERSGSASLDDDEAPMRRFGPGTGRSRYSAGAAAASPAPHRRPPADPDAPAWEQPRRFEAYPTIKTRRGMPGLSPLLLGIGGLAVAALLLFFVPPLLLGLGGDDSGATPTPSAAASSSPADASPTPLPSPTPTMYVVKQGDTLSGIAKAHGVTLDALIAANKATLPNPDRLQIGQALIIPTAPSEEVPAEPSPSPSPSP